MTDLLAEIATLIILGLALSLFAAINYHFYKKGKR